MAARARAPGGRTTRTQPPSAVMADAEEGNAGRPVEGAPLARAPESESALGRIRRIRGVRWRWKDEAPEEARALPGIGVIAQEVEAVFPELVQDDPRGFKSVYYPGLIAPLIEAVKELDARLTRIEERLGSPESAD